MNRDGIATMGPLGMGRCLTSWEPTICEGGCGRAVAGVLFCPDCLRINLEIESRRLAVALYGNNARLSPAVRADRMRMAKAVCAWAGIWCASVASIGVACTIAILLFRGLIQAGLWLSR